MTWPLDVRKSWELHVYACSVCNGHWEEPVAGPSPIEDKRRCPNGCLRHDGLPRHLAARVVPVAETDRPVARAS